MSGRLAGKTALVVDAGSAVGSAIVQRFTEEGAEVSELFLTSGYETASNSSTSDRAQQIGAAVADVTKPDTVDKSLKDIVQAQGSFDIATNALVKHGFSAVELVGDQTWHQEIEWNLGLTFRMVRAVSPGMKKRRSGSIITISSTAMDGVPWFAHRGHATHAAARAGILGFTRSLAYELGRYNVNINCVIPGPTSLPGEESVFGTLKDDPEAAVLPEATFALRRYATPQDIANAVLFFASDDSTYITGQTLHVSGGLYY